MLIGTTYLTQTHLILRDVDGSEVSVTLDDTLELYNFIKEHKKGIEQRIQENWQEFITCLDQRESDSVQ
jgi:hypothetical protein